MPTPQISALPTTPSRNMTADVFVPAMDTFLAALPQFRTEANAVATSCDLDAVATAGDRVQTGVDRSATTAAAAAAVAAAAQAAALPVTPATSLTPITIASSGDKAFTLVETGKAFGIGQDVKATSTADITRYMIGKVKSLVGQVLTVTVEGAGGSGSVSSWSIALIPPTATVFNGGTDVTGSNKQNVVAMAANDIDLSAGDFFSKSLASSATFTFSNPTASRAQVVIMALTLSSGAAPTWPAGGVWGGSTVPTLGNGRHVLALVTFDGWTSWTGIVLARATG